MTRNFQQRIDNACKFRYQTFNDSQLCFDVSHYGFIKIRKGFESFEIKHAFRCQMSGAMTSTPSA